MDMENFAKHMKDAEDSKILNQSSPKPRPSKIPERERLAWQIRTKQHNISNEIPGGFNFRSVTTILSGDSHSSKKSTDELQSIILRDLKVPMVHLGRFLVCQVVGMPYSVVSAITLIQDLNGDVEELSLYNFRYKLENLEWLNPGTIMIIKEPWLRYGTRDKAASLRVDSPTDVIFVDPTDYDFLKKVGAEKYISLTKNVEEIRKRANDCFGKKDYNNAIMLYDRAIRYNPDLAVLYLNKAMACLKIHAFYQANKAAKYALEKGGDPEKGLYRLGMAAYGMRQWQKAAQHFVEMLKQFPKNLLASDRLKKTTARLNEQKTGIFDYKSMYVESKKKMPEMDVSDYMGPIEISNIPGKGRGIIASKNIEKGTLLAVSKAFASGYSQDFPGTLLAINLIRKKGDTAAHMLQIIRAMENLQKNPQRTKELYDLYSGELEKNEAGEIPDGIVDAAKIQRISALNRFGSDEIPKAKNEMEKLLQMFESDNSHLFILPSYFNHSCLANAKRIFYGDVMVIHANTDIKKGEEICLAYVNPSLDFLERKKKLNGWNFECECKLCETDAADSSYSIRNKKVQAFTAYVLQNKKFPQKVIEKGEPLLKEIRITYSQRTEFKTNLAQMLFLLSPMHVALRNAEKSIEYLEEMVDIIDDQLQDAFNITAVLVNLSQCYFAVRNFGKAKVTLDKAFKLSLSYDMDHFIMLYPDIAQLL